MAEEKAENDDKASLRDAIEQAVESDDTPDEEPEKEPEKAEAAEEEAKDDTTAEEASESDPAEDTSQSDDTPAKEEEPEEVDAPAHWSLEHQELFRGLDGKAQKFLLDRSKDMEAAHTKRSQEIAPLRKSVEKWQPYLDKVGATADQAFDTLIAAEYRLRTGTEAQKREALTQLARDYGISLEQPKANGEAQEDYLTADIRKAVQPLQEELGSIRQTIAQRDEAAKQTQATQWLEQIQQFRDEKTEAGEPAHPYFDEVLEDMNVLAQAQQARGKTPDLKQLYDMATNANADVRAKIQAAQQYAAKLKEKRAQKKKVEKAKSADVSVTGVSTAPKEQPKSLRATIEEAMAS